ncbi:hypothetical protein BCU24_01225 [Vibrio cyclitrophicus]|uniref:hypothetical protein n=1 Tax=Vibrio cyclitrophicus TaxID=47951 RepID=UPI000C85B4F7|nr:hypothetical protein [Vibrio cyclitrophicus]PMJ40783.1 hypothetical protein BCU24_01225 [Vibrio cyclitrophicus]
MSSRISGVPEHWQDYFLCILLHMMFPFFPVFLEKLLAGTVASTSLMLFSAMYALSIGLSSYSKLLFGITIIISLFFSVAYGVLVSGGKAIPDAEVYAYISLIVIFVIHMLERYNRHVVDRTPFWEFA